MDKLVDVLQWDLTRKHIWAKVGGAEGMELTRCAFAVMVKFNQLWDVVNICCGQVEIFMADYADAKFTNAVYKELMQELSDPCDISKLSKLWELASKMRVWFQTKKQTISSEVKDKATKYYEQIVQDKASQKFKTKKETKKETKKGLFSRVKAMFFNDANEEEKIETTKEAVAVKFNEESYEEIKRDLEKEELGRYVQDIKEKAKLLLKLAVPNVWNQDEKNEEYLILDPISGENELEMDSRGVNEFKKLKSFRKIQSSKGTIKTYDDIDSKEIFNSSGASILAYLQWFLTVDEIMPKVEEVNINALNRYCGLKIFSDISHCYMGDESKCQVFDWLWASLRNNKNWIAHYADGLNGMSEYLRFKSSIEFYMTMAGIATQIKVSHDPDVISHLFNCWFWEIKARDQELLVRSGLLEVLIEGNGNEDAAKNPIK
jgi:hypothetical protein